MATTTPPYVIISAAALQSLREAGREAGAGDLLRLTIDGSFNNDLFFAPAELGDILVEASGLTLAMDTRTARRADGLAIDFVDGPGGSGFKLDNPNSKGSNIKGIHPADLAKSLKKREKLQLIDVRPAHEHAKAALEAARLLDAAYQAELDAVDKDAKLVFLAHHSRGAKAAAQEFYDRGFHNVWYVVGGIDGWSTMNPEVPRY